LTSEQVLQLDIELLLLLDDNILLDDLFSLPNQTLLECLNLLEHLPSVGVSSLQLPPSVVVEGILKLLREGLNAETLV
jgi:hypothetical protein